MNSLLRHRVCSLHVAVATPDPSEPVNVFTVLDKNGDGLVSFSEYFGVIQNTDGNRQLYRTEDKNGDGFITWQEFDGASMQRDCGG